MGRRVRWIVLLVVVLLVGAAAVLVLTARPDLQDGRSAVDTAWTPLREPLAARYLALAGVADAFDAAGQSQRAVARDLRDELARWQRLAAKPDADPEAEPEAANELEALATRARANVIASDRLRADAGITDAFRAFDLAVVSPVSVRAYNRAARDYEDTRHDLRHRAVADLLGYEARPVLLLAAGAVPS